jgi:hypothetical protein
MKGPGACFAGARLDQRIGEAPGLVREECIGISAPFGAGSQTWRPSEIERVKLNSQGKLVMTN